jgi:hypothetical protein
MHPLYKLKRANLFGRNLDLSIVEIDKFGL